MYGAYCSLSPRCYLCSNGCRHACAACKSGTYSPDVVTGMAAYLPLAIHGYSRFIQPGRQTFRPPDLARQFRTPDVGRDFG